jgi:hypothetical protein
MNLLGYSIARVAGQMARRIIAGEILMPAEQEAAEAAIVWTLERPEIEAISDRKSELSRAINLLWKMQTKTTKARP